MGWTGLDLGGHICERTLSFSTPPSTITKSRVSLLGHRSSTSAHHQATAAHPVPRLLTRNASPIGGHQHKHKRHGCSTSSASAFFCLILYSTVLEYFPSAFKVQTGGGIEPHGIVSFRSKPGSCAMAIGNGSSSLGAKVAPHLSMSLMGFGGGKRFPGTLLVGIGQQ